MGAMAPIEDIQEATRRLVRTVDAISEAEYVGPSALPDWSRAHVLAHLTLNAEALAGVLVGAMHAKAVPMYPSAEQRDGDIAALAGVSLADLRERLLASTTAFDVAVRAATEIGVDTDDHDLWAGTFERAPGGPVLPVGAVPGMREREVQIHHADLALAYGPDDWPPAFAERLVEAMLARQPTRALRLHAEDLDRTWHSGPGDATDPSIPTVHGAAADLGWWLSGRGDGRGLNSDDGVLPRIEGW